MVLNVVVLAIPLAFLIRLSGDSTLLGGLANTRRRTMLLWVLTGSLLSLGLWSAASVLGVGL
jgi:Mn2+/Fe2+ NRAMP family transporter